MPNSIGVLLNFPAKHAHPIHLPTVISLIAFAIPDIQNKETVVCRPAQEDPPLTTLANVYAKVVNYYKGPHAFNRQPVHPNHHGTRLSWSAFVLIVLNILSMENASYVDQTVSSLRQRKNVNAALGSSG